MSAESGSERPPAARLFNAFQLWHRFCIYLVCTYLEVCVKGLPSPFLTLLSAPEQKGRKAVTSLPGSCCVVSSYTASPAPLSRTGLLPCPTTAAIWPERETLFAQFMPLVNRLVRQYGKTPEMRQDLPGEIYYLFHTLLDRYDPERGIPLRPYLVRQLSAATYSLVRKQWREQAHELPLEESGYQCDRRLATSDPTPQWDTALQQRQFAAMLPRLIQKLPLRQRQVLILRYYENHSFKEIAHVLNIEQSSVRSLLRYAMKRLREQASFESSAFPFS